MKLDDLLHNFRNKKDYINIHAVVNEQYGFRCLFNLDELIDYGHYQVDDWWFDVLERKLFVAISKGEL